MAEHIKTRRMMVDTQIRPSDVTKFPIIDAMLSVPRERFVPDNMQDAAYLDGHIPLAPSRVVLEPRAFAKLLDALDIQPDEMVLDLGCGYGYSAAVIARMAEAVVALEAEDGLASEAERVLGETGADNVAVVSGALSEGAAKHGPYDVIIVEGGVEELPEALIDQLNEGGRIGCIFMQGALGEARVGRKSDGSVTWRQAFNAAAPVLPGFAREAAFEL